VYSNATVLHGVDPRYLTQVETRYSCPQALFGVTVHGPRGTFLQECDVQCQTLFLYPEELTWCLHRLQQEKQELEGQRLRKFCSVTKAVNCSLGGIYQKLTAGQGDAYLTYTEDTLLLFAEGVHFHVRCASA